jgi:hypothetical protein
MEDSMGNVGETEFYDKVMSETTPGKVSRYYEWKEQAPTDWAFDRVLLDGVITELRVPVYDRTEGRKVRDKRRELGLGLREAAEKLRMSSVRLSELEQGIIVPSGSSSTDKILAWLEVGT